MILYVTEKPSLAEAVSKALAKLNRTKARKIANKHWEVGSDCQVTWLFGHMIANAPPESYGEEYKRWSLDTLPIIPEQWKMLNIKGKSDHISHVKALMKSATEIVNAGDAGREGQLLVDELIIKAGINAFGTNVKRLWVSSVLEADLIKGIKGIFPNKEKEPLYRAALARSHLDWLHGMNLTRLYTIKAQQAGNRGVVSVGRVQTPTLKLIVDRDLKIENFKPIDYFEPTVQFEHPNGRFNAVWVAPENQSGLDEDGRLIDEAIAKEIAIRVANKTGTITDFKSQKKKKTAPLPFNLSALQSECSAKLKLSAARTLEIAQELYESDKVVSYPRSDSRYLPTGILKDEAPTILQNLTPIGGDIGTAAANANISVKSQAWNDKKISDHHAIIPTVAVSAEKVEKLTGDKRKVFDIIAKQFIAQFYPDNEYLSLSALVSVEEDTFKANGSRMLVEGWRVVLPMEKKSDDDQGLPDMVKGDTAKVMLSKAEAKKTKPPARFTDGSLVSAMASIHKFITEEGDEGSSKEHKKRLRENDGIGTEATRANIIETLLQRKFIERKSKTQLISTQAGRQIIATLPSAISDPCLTAIWEGGLSDIAAGVLTYEKIMNAQVQVLKRRIDEGKAATVNIQGLANGKGAKSAKPRKTVEPIKGHGECCSKCDDGKMVTRLISKGSNAGKSFLSCDQYPKCNNAVFPESKKPAQKIAKDELLEGHDSDCPTCSDGKMVTRKSKTGKFFLGCNAFPKCKHTEWVNS